MAFNSWRGPVEALRAARANAARMLNQGAVRALRSWRETFLQMKEDQRLRLWTAKRFAGDPKVSGFAQWRRNVEGHAASFMR